MSSRQGRAGALVTVVGLGPAGTDLMTASATSAISEAARSRTAVLFRTGRHPAASELLSDHTAGDRADTFDSRYHSADRFETVYESIVSSLVDLARSDGRVVYAVPGSPFVAERTVELLRLAAAEGAGISLRIIPGLSFCDLAWARLGIDPLAKGVRIVDGTAFDSAAADDYGPLLVGQCWSNSVLSGIKLAITEPATSQRAVLLHHLGLDDEQVVDVTWEDLDRTLEADHLTSLYIPELTVPAGAELARLAEVVAKLRSECPWDRQQTHRSLVRHLLEEAYEAMEALDALGDEPAAAPAENVRHAEEELGDLLCQVVFHSTLAAEEGLFELADVARVITEKLVHRHPHVFGSVVAETAGDVERNWEQLKRDEKGRESLLAGIPASLPVLARVATVERRLASVGLGWRGSETTGEDGALTPASAILALARRLAASGYDPEGAVRQELERLGERVTALEAACAETGRGLAELTEGEREGWRQGGRDKRPAP